MATWAGQVDALTMFAEDLDAVRDFAERVLELPVHFEEDHSVVYRLGGLLLNYLDVREADDLIAPASVGDSTAGVRVQLTVGVSDVHAVAQRIQDAGWPLLRGPEVRPWGMTTATFRDPAGHVWEIAC
ncbi:MAG: VOC family protein [Frankiales bacterium]|nr:VOC family protein [Frankiales bacterium]